MPLFEPAVKSIAGCEKLPDLHLYPQFCYLFFQDQPSLARVPSPSTQTALDLEGLGPRWGETGKKTLPTACSDICLIFLSLSEILPQLGLGKSPLCPRGCRSLLFILLPTTPHLLSFKSGSCRMIFKEQQISTRSGRLTLKGEVTAESPYTFIIGSHVPVLGAFPPFLFQMIHLWSSKVCVPMAAASTELDSL